MASRMKFSWVFALSLIGQIGLASLSAQANTIQYAAATDKQPGQFEGELPIKSLSSLKLPNGTVQFKGEDVNVFAVPDWLFDRNLVLSGALVRAEYVVPSNTTGAGNSASNTAMIAGLAYFLGGEWLTNLATPRAVDVIETMSGERIHGRILSRMDNAFAFKPDDGGTRKVNFSDIKTISSPRAFHFVIPAREAKINPDDDSFVVEADKISFSPTLWHGRITGKPSVPKSTLAGADPGIRKSTIATFLALDIVDEIAPAIAIPLVLNRSNQSAALNELNRFNAGVTSVVVGH